MIEIPYARDTAFDPEAWTPERPTTGHCAVAALIFQDVFGGTLQRCIGPDGQSHYFNRLDDALIDLTAAQFDETPNYHSATERTREYVLSNPRTRERYELLRLRCREGRL